MEVETGLSVCVSDFDLKSIYPSLMVATNSSRMTLKFVPYEIEGRGAEDMHRYFVNMINIRENAVTLCTNYHGLPTYAEMASLVSERINQKL